MFFRDDPAFKNRSVEEVLIQRVQIFGSSAIHAPVALQHYLVAMHSEGKTLQTLDMPQWLRKHASMRILEGVVLEDGAVCYTVLDEILVPHESGSTPRVDFADYNPSTLAAMMPHLRPRHLD